MLPTDNKLDSSQVSRRWIVRLWLMLIVSLASSLLYSYSTIQFGFPKPTRLASLPQTKMLLSRVSWISSDEIVLPQLESYDGGFCSIFNIKTSKLTKLTGLEAASLREVQRSKLPASTDVTVSPDGSKYFAYLGGYILGDDYERITYDRTGKVLDIETIFGEHAVIDGNWLPNSLGVVKSKRYKGSQTDHHFTLCYFDGRKPVEADYSVPKGMRLSSIRFDNDGSALAIESRAILPDKRPWSLARFSLLNPKNVDRIPLTNSINAFDSRISPDGKKVLIRCRDFKHFPPTGLWKLLSRWAHIRDTYSSALWICNSDGSNLHRIAQVDHPSSEPMNPEQMAIHSCQWMPDGKHLSYIHKNVLYSIPAD